MIRTIVIATALVLATTVISSAAGATKGTNMRPPNTTHAGSNPAQGANRQNTLKSQGTTKKTKDRFDYKLKDIESQER